MYSFVFSVCFIRVCLVACVVACFVFVFCFHLLGWWCCFDVFFYLGCYALVVSCGFVFVQFVVDWWWLPRFLWMCRLPFFFLRFRSPPPLNRSSPPHIGYILIPTYNLYKTLISLKESREESKGGERRTVQNWSPGRPAGPRICWSPAGRPRQDNFHLILHKKDH